MTIIAYEDNQDIANAYVSWTGVLGSAKSMRCSFEVNGIPAEGSFTVATRELFGYGTTVDLLFGIFAPAGQFDMEAPMLLGAIDSIRLIRDYFCICFDCPAYGCDYHCTNGCCDHPCDEYDRCKEAEWWQEQNEKPSPRDYGLPVFRWSPIWIFVAQQLQRTFEQRWRKGKELVERNRVKEGLNWDSIYYFLDYWFCQEVSMQKIRDSMGRRYCILRMLEHGVGISQWTRS